ncbi:FLYWCH-type domain-containing protein [Aphis craccivora]|uniref:FLYWCH-type domain-containing protein n=1 Tax=Aphis craccivora TaxID=307492 RepID=A0A6G0ZIV5_APHCR|nr:FLYWCH-type domain-containing protein [Aphis craccivora]
MPKLIESTKERDVLMNNGYMYLFDALRSDGKLCFWRFRNKNECKARVHTTVDDIEIIKSIKEHTNITHDSEAPKIEGNIVVNRIKRCAAETAESASNVINEFLAGLSEAAKVGVIII